jgi:hypothetical protein
VAQSGHHGRSLSPQMTCRSAAGGPAPKARRTQWVTGSSLATKVNHPGRAFEFVVRDHPAAAHPFSVLAVLLGAGSDRETRFWHREEDLAPRTGPTVLSTRSGTGTYRRSRDGARSHYAAERTPMLDYPPVLRSTS